MLWFHRLLNPHCEHCIEMERAKRECISCDILKQEVARLQIENDRLLNIVLKNAEPKHEEIRDINSDDLKPIGHSNFRSWNVRRQMLEESDRKAAQIRQEKERELKLNPEHRDLTINEIEKELGVQ